ncbi:DUF202 domain-containing protein [Thermomonospora umbrina]|uniref:DUF202 domain-containing protein n=1 Tax=Thermomonospora umbrina TaxID=111806 RepID=UPI00147779DD|nr:DUF202 domain-containing protein [Thermomonospora umbrina]
MAAERTELAWTRTAVSMLALGAAMTKVSPVAGVVMLAVGVGAWAGGRVGSPGAGPRRWVVPVLGLAVTVVAMIALATTLVSLGRSGHGPLGDLGLLGDRRP